jgi:hypothetical protein
MVATSIPAGQTVPAMPPAGRWYLYTPGTQRQELTLAPAASAVPASSGTDDSGGDSPSLAPPISVRGSGSSDSSYSVGDESVRDQPVGDDMLASGWERPGGRSDAERDDTTAAGQQLTWEEDARQIDEWLDGNGLRRVAVPGDGNCTYHGLIAVGGEHLRGLFGLDVLEPINLRSYLAAVLRHDQSVEAAGQPSRYGGLIRESGDQPRAGAWADHIARIETDGEYDADADAAVVAPSDVAPSIAAFELDLPLTLVQPGPDGPLVTDVGPPGQDRYVLVLHGEHYWATEPLEGPGPQPATVPEDQVRAELAQLEGQFGWLRERYAELSVSFVPADDGEREARDATETRAAGYVASFNQILGQDRPEHSVQPVTAFLQQRLQRLQDSHREWLSAVRGIFPDIAPSEDAAGLTIDDLRAYQQEQLAPPAAPADLGQHVARPRSAPPGAGSVGAGRPGPSTRPRPISWNNSASRSARGSQR